MTNEIFRTLPLALVAATIAGCTGGGSGGTSPNDQASLSSIYVSLASSTLTVGQGTQASAELRDADGNVLTNRAVAWTTGSSSVAVVDTSGLVTAVGSGSTLIIATSEGKTGSATLTVFVTPVATLTVATGLATISVGQSTLATATPRDAQGNDLSGRSISWNSSDVRIATVDGTGQVTGVGVGSATITATCEGKSGSTAVSVFAPPSTPVSTVTVTLASANLYVGQTTQATAVLRDAGGDVLSGRMVSWTSSSTAVATVSSSGVVTAISTGSAIISATSEGRTGSATVTVALPPVASVSVSVAASSIYIGQTTQATAVLLDASGDVLQGRIVDWSSSSSTIATVNSNGVVTAYGEGTAVIFASSGGRTGSATLTVTGVVVSISPTSASVTPNGSMQFAATVTGTSDSSVVWTASAGTINASGLFIAPDGPSSVTIRATSNADQRRFGTAYVNVVPLSSSDVLVTVHTEQVTTYPPYLPYFQVSVTVMARYPIQTVIASIEGQALSLNEYGGGGWGGFADLSALPSGSHWLLVTVVDVNGNRTDAYEALIIDRPPSIAFEPLSDSVVGTVVPFTAGCTDDFGCSLQMAVGNNPATSHGASVSGELLLGAQEGELVHVILTATDTKGQKTRRDIPLYVETSNRIRRVADYQGPVIDIVGDLVLYSEIQANGDFALMFRAGSSAPIRLAGWTSGVGRGFDPRDALLTPSGPLWVFDDGQGYYIYHYTDDKIVRLGSLLDDFSQINPWLGRVPSWAVCGDYVAWASKDGALVRRDLAENIEVVVDGSGHAPPISIASNGDAVYTRWSSVWLLSGASASLVGDPSVTYRQPITDGVNVIAARDMGTSTNGYPNWEVAVLGSGVEELLGTLPQVGPSSWDPGERQYAVSGGWTSYMLRNSSLGGADVWARDALGVIAPRVASFLADGGSSYENSVEAIGSDGTAIVRALNRRWRVRPSAQPEDIGSANGRAVVRGGTFFIIMGRSVFQIVDG